MKLVYLHVDSEGRVIYVGSGTWERAHRKRSGEITVKIFAVYTDPRDALRAEAWLIRELKSPENRQRPEQILDRPLARHHHLKYPAKSWTYVRGKLWL